MSASGTASVPELTAKVTARSISLTDTDGVRVTRLEPSTYRFIVKDLTRAQNFHLIGPSANHLIGPSVNRRTKVPAKVTTSWTVYLPPGTYTYRSDKSATMSGTFVVRPGPPPA
jgi:hypothetical protein